MWFIHFKTDSYVYNILELFLTVYCYYLQM